MYAGESVPRCVDGDVQLAGGPNELEGRVELCDNGKWAQACGGGGWGKIVASIICNTTEQCEFM